MNNIDSEKLNKLYKDMYDKQAEYYLEYLKYSESNDVMKVGERIRISDKIRNLEVLKKRC